MCPTGLTSPNPTPKSNLRTAFDVLDADADGRISYDDLRAFFHGEDEDMLNWMMSVADSNQDGYVEYDEFQKVLNQQQQQKKNNYNGEKRNARFAGGAMEDAFRVMDKDGDGVVGHQDLKSYLNSVGLEANDDDVRAMISLGNQQGQAGVTLEALLDILAV